jgi:hypothetical protein
MISFHGGGESGENISMGLKNAQPYYPYFDRP